MLSSLVVKLLTSNDPWNSNPDVTPIINSHFHRKKPKSKVVNFELLRVERGTYLSGFG